MGRIRTIKPDFPHSESMGEVSRDARLTFILLFTISDDEGRARGNSRMLASLLYPYDNDAPHHMDAWLSELESVNCIERYTIDGTSYLQITNWLEHQRVDKPSKSKFPPPRESSRILASPREDSLRIRNSIRKGSITPPIVPPTASFEEPKTPEPASMAYDEKEPKGEQNYTAEFERFWGLYPKYMRKEKPAAFRAWKVAVTKQTPEKICDSLVVYCSSKQVKDGYASYPAKWLKNERWNEDHDNANGTDRAQKSRWGLNLDPNFGSSIRPQSQDVDRY